MATSTETVDSLKICVIGAPGVGKSGTKKRFAIVVTSYAYVCLVGTM